MRYSFSGHESFHCKSLWLKKGYDFICNKKHFADTDSVVELGVGKNMVSAIRYWLKAFSLTKEDTLTDLAEYIFSTNTGRDPFCEDIATLGYCIIIWLNLKLQVFINLYSSIFNVKEGSLTKYSFYHSLKESAVYLNKRTSIMRIPFQKT